MFNPFVQFMPKLIDALRLRGERYLVSQTFRPGIDMFAEGRQVLMFCHYSDLGFAQIHLHAVRADKYAAIIDLERDGHLYKVKEMLAPRSAYLVFSNLVRDQQALHELLDKQYAYKLRRYIDRHTTWRITGNGGIRPKMQLIFGELFVVVRYGSQQIRVKFAEIETF